MFLRLRRYGDRQQTRNEGLRQPFGQACVKESVRRREWRRMSLQAAMGKVFPNRLRSGIDLDCKVSMLNPRQDGMD